MGFLRRQYNIVAIIIAVLLVYSNSFNCSFHFDDLRLIVDGMLIKQPELLFHPEYWKNPIYRIISLLSFAFDYHMWGLNVVGYHITSTLFHLGTAFLVYWFSTLVLARVTNYNSAQIKLLATFAGLLFAVHPIQTQSVVYIVQRMSILAAFFYVFSLISYIYLRNFIENKKYITSSIVGCVFVLLVYLALFSKQNAATLPFALLGIEFFIFWKHKSSRFIFVPIIVISIVSALWYVVMTTGLPHWLPGVSRWQYLIAQFRAILHYVQVVVLPVNQSLDPTVYFNTSPWHFKEMMGLLIIIGLLVTMMLSRKRHKAVGFGIWFMFSALLIESSVIPIADPIVEHRMYLPMAGISILLAYTIGLISHTMPERMKYCLVGSVVLFYGAFTFARNFDWRTDISLWEAEIENHPDNPRAMLNLGYSYFEAGDIDKAQSYISKSQELDPGSCYGMNSMGEVLMEKGDTGRALYLFHKAVEMCDFSYSMNNLAIHHMREKEYSRAQEYVTRSLMKKNYHKTHYLQYVLYKQQGNEDKAEEHLRIANLLNPIFDYQIIDNKINKKQTRK